MPDTPLTDAEVICTFMEPRHVEGQWWTHGKSVRAIGPEVWFRNAQGPLRATITTDRMVPRTLTLDALWEVEERLDEQQRQHYCCLMFQWCCREAHTANPVEMELTKNRYPLLHATAEQKIRALAATLRSRVLPEQSTCGDNCAREAARRRTAAERERK